MMGNKENDIMIYEDNDGVTKVNVKFVDEDVWLTQNQLAEIYKTTQENIRTLGAELFTDDLVYIKEESKSKKDVLRHNYIKLGYLLYTLSLNYEHMLRVRNNKDQK